MSPPSARIPVSRVEIKTFCYPTEDRERVISAMLALLPEDIRDPREIKATKLRSVHRFSFEEFKLEVRGRRAREVIAWIFSRLPEADRRQLLETLDKRVDGSRLYVRIDKQEAVDGSLRLHGGGIGGHIHVVAAFSRAVPVDLISEYLRGGGEGSEEVHRPEGEAGE